MSCIQHMLATFDNAGSIEVKSRGCADNKKPSLPSILPGVSLVLRYLTKGFQAAEEYLAEERAKGVVDPEAAEVLAYLRGVHEVKRTSDEQAAARLVEMHDLALEHVPTHFLKSKEVGARKCAAQSMFPTVHRIRREWMPQRCRGIWCPGGLPVPYSFVL